VRLSAISCHFFKSLKRLLPSTISSEPGKGCFAKELKLMQQINQVIIFEIMMTMEDKAYRGHSVCEISWLITSWHQQEKFRLTGVILIECS
jgi:hypothetical protein